MDADLHPGMPFAAAWVARHRFLAPIGVGLVSGALGGPLMVGAVIPGYLVGRAGGGTERVGLAALAMVAGLVILFTAAIAGSSATCPSCVDMVIISPFVGLFLLIPFGLGRWLGERAYRRHQATG